MLISLSEVQFGRESFKFLQNWKTAKRESDFLITSSVFS